MPAQRKIFRIEENAVAHRSGDSAPAGLRHVEVMRALGALSAALAVPSAHPALHDSNRKHAATPLQAEHLTRMAHELDAVTENTAQATQKILAAAEEIDQIANTLAASLKGKTDQGLAQDISDLVIRIFEACNFQDLVGQRVAKIRSRLEFDEAQIDQALADSEAAAAAAHHNAAQFLHGPRLDSDAGHMSQDEIDTLFGG